MPCYSIRLLCALLHLHCEPRSEAEGVFEDGYVELFEDLLLLVGEGFLQVLVMPCHVLYHISIKISTV